jgi:hypothetical protein
MDLQRIAKKAMDVGYGIDPDNLPRSCSITRTTGQTYDPVTDTYTGGTTTTYEFQAFRGKDYELTQIDGTVIQAGDMLLKTSQLDLTVEPENGEAVTVDGVDWTIINHSADPARATWWMQVRK